MSVRTRFGLILVVSLMVLVASIPAEAVSKCLVWVWIDGWRCAIGI